MSKTRTVLIGALVVVVLAMSVGYAALNQNLFVDGTANISSTWKIGFSSISEGTTLAAGSTNTITVKAEYDSSVTTQPTTTNRQLYVTLNYVQA